MPARRAAGAGDPTETGTAAEWYMSQTVKGARAMLNRFLPAKAGNEYRGYKIGLWIFGFIILWKLAIALGCIFNGYGAANNADGIPLQTFGATGAHALVTEYAVWGVGQVALLTIAIVVLIRYRSLVPFLFAVVLFEHIARRAAYTVLPLPHVSGAAGGTINIVMLAVMIAGLACTVLTRRNAQPAVPA